MQLLGPWIARALGSCRQRPGHERLVKFWRLRKSPIRWPLLCLLLLPLHNDSLLRLRLLPHLFLPGLFLLPLQKLLLISLLRLSLLLRLLLLPHLLLPCLLLLPLLQEFLLLRLLTIGRCILQDVRQGVRLALARLILNIHEQ